MENIGIFENIVGILVKNSRIFDPFGRIFFFKAGIYWNISPKKADLGNIYPCLAEYFFGIFDLSWKNIVPKATTPQPHIFRRSLKN